VDYRLTRPEKGENDSMIAVLFALCACDPSPCQLPRLNSRDLRNTVPTPTRQSTPLSTTVDNSAGLPTRASTLASVSRSDAGEYSTEVAGLQEEICARDRPPSLTATGLPSGAATPRPSALCTTPPYAILDDCLWPRPRAAGPHLLSTGHRPRTAARGPCAERPELQSRLRLNTISSGEPG
jgi:hypothetical protein